MVDLAKVSAQIGRALAAVPEKEAAKFAGLVSSVVGGSLPVLNDELQSGTYVSGTTMTAADAELYAAAYPHLAKASIDGTTVNVFRWFDHLQALGVGAALGLANITIDLNTPYVLTAAEKTHAEEAAKGKKKEEEPKKEGAKDNGAAAAAKPDAPAKDKKGAEKPAKGAAAAPAPAPEDNTPLPARLDIRVGHILKAWRHPDAEALYVEEIDVGEEKPRQVVSGLVKFVPEAEMQGKRCLVLCNLKPAAMRGIQSSAMVLCASNADHTKVEFVNPPAAAKPGDRVFFPGMESFKPDELLNPKKKVFETVQPDFNTDEKLVARWKDLPFTTSSGICTVSSIAGGNIK